MSLTATLTTERLVLRPFTRDDAPAIAEICSDRDVARFTATVPHPYPPDAADKWLDSLFERQEQGKALSRAVIIRESGQQIGGVGLAVDPDQGRAELGYHLAKAAWGQGYATEAAGAVLRHGFEQLQLDRIHAGCFACNPGSFRVLTKIGLRHEGTRYGHIKKWGTRHDVHIFGLTREEYARSGSAGSPECEQCVGLRSG